MSQPMSFEVHLGSDFDAAVETVEAELKKEGFGVLTRIDVHTAMKEKIGKDFRPYVILGACNPPLAYRALSARPDVGLMLPCNVTVESDPDGGCLVRVVNPHMMMAVGGLDDDENLREVGREAYEGLSRVASALEDLSG